MEFEKLNEYLEEMEFSETERELFLSLLDVYTEKEIIDFGEEITTNADILRIWEKYKCIYDVHDFYKVIMTGDYEFWNSYKEYGLLMAIDEELEIRHEIELEEMAKRKLKDEEFLIESRYGTFTIFNGFKNYSPIKKK